MHNLKTYRLALLVLLAMMTVSGLHSQGTDTSKVWILRQDALKKLAQAEEAKVLKEVVKQKQDDIDLLNARIQNAEKIISTFVEKEDNNTEIIKQLQEQKKIMEDQKKILLDEVAKINKQLRKEKRKRFWTAMAGVATTAGAFWLGSNL